MLTAYRWPQCFQRLVLFRQILGRIRHDRFVRLLVPFGIQKRLPDESNHTHQRTGVRPIAIPRITDMLRHLILKDIVVRRPTPQADQDAAPGEDTPVRRNQRHSKTESAECLQRFVVHSILVNRSILRMHGRIPVGYAALFLCRRGITRTARWRPALLWSGQTHLAICFNESRIYCKTGVVPHVRICRNADVVAHRLNHAIANNDRPPAYCLSRRRDDTRVRECVYLRRIVPHALYRRGLRLCKHRFLRQR